MLIYSWVLPLGLPILNTHPSLQNQDEEHAIKLNPADVALLAQASLLQLFRRL